MLFLAVALAMSTFVGAAQDGEQCRSQHQSASLLGTAAVFAVGLLGVTKPVKICVRTVCRGKVADVSAYV